MIGTPNSLAMAWLLGLMATVLACGAVLAMVSGDWGYAAFFWVLAAVLATKTCSIFRARRRR